MSRLARPGFSGVRAPQTSGLRPPGSSGLRPPRPQTAVCPPSTNVREPQASGLRPPASGLRPPASGLRPPTSGLRAPGSGLRPPSSGLRAPQASASGTGPTRKPPGTIVTEETKTTRTEVRTLPTGQQNICPAPVVSTPASRITPQGASIPSAIQKPTGLRAPSGIARPSGIGRPLAMAPRTVTPAPCLPMTQTISPPVIEYVAQLPASRSPSPQRLPVCPTPIPAPLRPSSPPRAVPAVSTRPSGLCPPSGLRFQSKMRGPLQRPESQPCPSTTVVTLPPRAVSPPPRVLTPPPPAGPYRSPPRSPIRSPICSPLVSPARTPAQVVSSPHTPLASPGIPFNVTPPRSPIYMDPFSPPFRSPIQAGQQTEIPESSLLDFVCTETTSPVGQSPPFLQFTPLSPERRGRVGTLLSFSPERDGTCEYETSPAPQGTLSRYCLIDDEVAPLPSGTSPLDFLEGPQGFQNITPITTNVLEEFDTIAPWSPESPDRLSISRVPSPLPVTCIPPGMVRYTNTSPRAYARGSPPNQFAEWELERVRPLDDTYWATSVQRPDVISGFGYTPGGCHVVSPECNYSEWSYDERNLDPEETHAMLLEEDRRIREEARQRLLTQNLRPEMAREIVPGGYVSPESQPPVDPCYYQQMLVGNPYLHVTAPYGALQGFSQKAYEVGDIDSALQFQKKAWIRDKSQRRAKPMLEFPAELAEEYLVEPPTGYYEEAHPYSLRTPKSRHTLERRSRTTQQLDPLTEEEVCVTEETTDRETIEEAYDYIDESDELDENACGHWADDTQWLYSETLPSPEKETPIPTPRNAYAELARVALGLPSGMLPQLVAQPPQRPPQKPLAPTDINRNYLSIQKHEFPQRTPDASLPYRKRMLQALNQRILQEHLRRYGTEESRDRATAEEERQIHRLYGPLIQPVELLRQRRAYYQRMGQPNPPRRCAMRLDRHLEKFLPPSQYRKKNVILGGRKLEVEIDYGQTIPEVPEPGPSEVTQCETTRRVQYLH